MLFSPSCTRAASTVQHLWLLEVAGLFYGGLLCCACEWAHFLA